MNKRVETLYAVIKDAEEQLEQIRKECPHTETFNGAYQWWDHYITMADICSNCGKALKETGPFI